MLSVCVGLNQLFKTDQIHLPPVTKSCRVVEDVVSWKTSCRGRRRVTLMLIDWRRSPSQPLSLCVALVRSLLYLVQN